MDRRSAETFGNNHNSEVVEAPKLKFGGVEMSFSFSEMEPRELEIQEEPETEDEEKGEEGRKEEKKKKEERAQRVKSADARRFMVGLLLAETQGVDGMAKALEHDDYRIKRSWRREFREAVSKMSAEEYAKRIGNVLGAFETDSGKGGAMEMADDLWLKAHEQALDDGYNKFEDKFEEQWGPAQEEMRQEAPMPLVQSEVRLWTPEAQQVTHRNYRSQKNKQRSRGFFGRLKETFGGKKKARLEAVRQAAAQSGNRFNNTSYYQEPARGQYFQGYRGQPEQGVYYASGALPPSDDSWDVWGGQ